MLKKDRQQYASIIEYAVHVRSDPGAVGEYLAHLPRVRVKADRDRVARAVINQVHSLVRTPVGETFTRHLPALSARPSGAVGPDCNGSAPFPVMTGFDGDAMPGPR